MRSHARVRMTLSNLASSKGQAGSAPPLPSFNATPLMHSRTGVRDTRPAELVIHSVRLKTNGPLVSVSVADGVIQAIAPGRNAVGHDTACPRVIDGGGALLLPGFCDSHVHLLVGAERLDACDLEGVTTFTELRSRLQSFITANPEQHLIYAHGLAYTTPPLLPPAEARLVLDEIIPDRPLFIHAHDLHTGWGNTRALAEADLLKPMPPFPPLLSALGMENNVTIGSDGIPGGEFREPEAYFLLECPLRARHPIPATRKLECLNRSCRQLAACGLTAVHTMGLGLPEEDLETLMLLLELEHSGCLSIRVSGSMSIIPDDHFHRDLQRAILVRDLLAEGRRGHRHYHAVHDALLDLLEAASSPRCPHQVSLPQQALFDHVLHSLHGHLQQAHLKEHRLHRNSIRQRWPSDRYMDPGGLVEWNSIKIFMDGVIEKDTAFRLGTNPIPGIPAYTQDKLIDLIERADRAGLQVSAHSIGNGSVARFLDAVEIVRAKHKSLDTRRGHRIRHRIEHIETCRHEDIPRFAALEVIASMQPLHEREPVRLWHRKIPDSEWETAFPWKKILETGGIVTFGSDWPIVTCRVLESIKHAVSRKPWQPHLPATALSVREATHGFTVGPAKTRHAEKQRGRILPGMAADMVLIAGDLPAGNAAILATITNGRVVYHVNS